MTIQDAATRSDSRRKPKARGIDTNPVLVRLRDAATDPPDDDTPVIGTRWSAVLARVHALAEWRRPAVRTAYQAEIDRLVGNGPDALYVVDDNGYLRLKEKPAGRGPMDADSIQKAIAALDEWLDGRKIGGTHGTLFWFVSGRPTKQWGKIGVDEDDKPIYGYAYVAGFRQDRRLDAAELGRFRALPDEVQEAILLQAPRHDVVPRIIREMTAQSAAA